MSIERHCCRFERPGSGALSWRSQWNAQGQASVHKPAGKAEFVLNQQVLTQLMGWTSVSAKLKKQRCHTLHQLTAADPPDAQHESSAASSAQEPSCFAVLVFQFFKGLLTLKPLCFLQLIPTLVSSKQKTALAKSRAAPGQRAGIPTPFLLSEFGFNMPQEVTLAAMENRNLSESVNICDSKSQWILPSNNTVENLRSAPAGDPVRLLPRCQPTATPKSNQQVSPQLNSKLTDTLQPHFAHVMNL